MSRRLRHLLRRWSFPLVGWLSALLYFVVAGGLPLPIPTTAIKDVSVPFPCMDSPCGCRNAEQCWASCCCHSPAERIAWAREHGVTPPHTLIVMVDTHVEATTEAAGVAGIEHTSCGAAKHSCCETKSECRHESPSTSKHQPTETFSILGMRALACHGFGTNWLTAVVAVPPVVVDVVQPLAAESAFVVPPMHFFSPAFPPPVPPPRPALS